MRNWLPLCFAAALVAAPVQAQYIFVDVDGDQQCTYLDVAPFSDGAIDVWLDTSHDAAGNPVTCATGEDLTISAYEVILYASDISVTGWTNAIPEFPQSLGIHQAGNFVSVGNTSSGASTHLAPGLHKLGTVTTTSNGGCVYLHVAGSAVIDGHIHSTGFYSQCSGLDGDYTLRLGQEFFDSCGTSGVCDDAEDQISTTWGKIKQAYLAK